MILFRVHSVWLEVHGCCVLYQQICLKDFLRWNSWILQVKKVIGIFGSANSHNVLILRGILHHYGTQCTLDIISRASLRPVAPKPKLLLLRSHLK